MAAGSFPSRPMNRSSVQSRDLVLPQVCPELFLDASCQNTVQEVGFSGRFFVLLLRPGSYSNNGPWKPACQRSFQPVGILIIEGPEECLRSGAGPDLPPTLLVDITIRYL